MKTYLKFWDQLHSFNSTEEFKMSSNTWSLLYRDDFDWFFLKFFSVDIFHPKYNLP